MHVAGIATVCRSAEVYKKKSTTIGKKGSRWRKKIETPVPYKLKFVAISCCGSKHYCTIALAQTSGVLQTLNFSSNTQTIEKRYANIYTFLHILDPIFCLLYGSGNIWEHNRTKAAVWQEDKRIQNMNKQLWFYRSHEGGIYSRHHPLLNWLKRKILLNPRVWQAKLKSTDPFSIDLPSSTDCVGSDLS
jgi:hypothetical protein